MTALSVSFFSPFSLSLLLTRNQRVSIPCPSSDDTKKSRKMNSLLSDGIERSPWLSPLWRKLSDQLARLAVTCQFPSGCCCCSWSLEKCYPISVQSLSEKSNQLFDGTVTSRANPFFLFLPLSCAVVVNDSSATKVISQSHSSS